MWNVLIRLKLGVFLLLFFLLLFFFGGGGGVQSLSYC